MLRTRKNDLPNALRVAGHGWLPKFLALAFAALLALPLAAQPISWTVNTTDTKTEEKEENIDTWDNETINLTTTDAGTMSFEVEGAYLLGISGEEDICGSGTRDLPNGWFARTDGRFALPLRKGTYVLKVIPHGTTVADYRIKAHLADVCAGVSGDDHGDDSLCSTDICVSATATSGSIGSYTDPDYDFFSFVLTSQSSVTVESTGSTDVMAELFNERGKRLASDDDGAVDGVNFKIVQSLPAGRYFVRVEGASGATGSYSLTVQ